MATLAARIGRHHPYVKDYEDGQRRLDVVQLMEVAWALDTWLTAIAKFLADNPPSTDGTTAGAYPEFAEASGQRTQAAPSESSRDQWYQAEWSRLCRLLRDIRQRGQQPDRPGLREQDVADRLDEPQSFVSKYETMRRRLDLVELEQIAAALDTTLVELVSEFEHDALPYGAAADD